MLLDGAHLVSDAIAAGVAIELAAITPASREDPDVQALVSALQRNDVETITVSASVMDAVSPVKTPSGIVALAERPAVDLAKVYASGAPLVVCAVDVQDPGNLGAIVRVCEAAGATGFVATGDSANPFSWKALRGAMGGTFRLPIAARGTVPDVIAAAHDHDVRIVAAVPRSGTPLPKMDFRQPIAIVIGGEGAGVSTAIMAAADASLTIPMRAPVESLNVAVAAALVLYEAARQIDR